MIKIDWTKVEAAKAQLFRDGADETLEMVVMVLYYSRQECDKIQITLDQLERTLFDVGYNDDVKGIFLFDITGTTPYLKCEEPNRVNILESVPNSGHPNVIVEFEKMSPEARAVWTEIMLVGAQHYIGQGV